MYIPYTGKGTMLIDGKLYIYAVLNGKETERKKQRGSRQRDERKTAETPAHLNAREEVLMHFGCEVVSLFLQTAIPYQSSSIFPSENRGLEDSHHPKASEVSSVRPMIADVDSLRMVV